MFKWTAFNSVRGIPSHEDHGQILSLGHPGAHFDLFTSEFDIFYAAKNPGVEVINIVSFFLCVCSLWGIQAGESMEKAWSLKGTMEHRRSKECGAHLLFVPGLGPRLWLFESLHVPWQWRAPEHKMWRELRLFLPVMLPVSFFGKWGIKHTITWSVYV